MSFDVFISYPHQNEKTADAACAALEAAGVRCWIAPRDIAPGASWAAEIMRAISGAKVMVVIFSAHANASPQIMREVERAVNRRVTIIPLRIEAILPTDDLEYFLSTTHWLDALTPPLEQHIERLVQRVTGLLRAPPQAPTKKASEREEPAKDREGRKAVLYGTDGEPVQRARLLAEEAERRALADRQEKERVEEAERAVREQAEKKRAASERRRQAAAARREREEQAEAEAKRKADEQRARDEAAARRQADEDERKRRVVRAQAEAADRAAIERREQAEAEAKRKANEEHPPIRTFRGHAGPVTSVAFAPDGRTALSASRDNTLKLWPVAGAEQRGFWGKVTDLAGGKELRTFHGPKSEYSNYWFTAVAISPDGRSALSASTDYTVTLWSTKSGSNLRVFHGHTNMVRAVAFSPDGRSALSGSWDNTLKLWDIESGRELRSFTSTDTDSLSGRITSISMSRDGRTALSTYGKSLKLWDLASGRELHSLEVGTFSVDSAALAPDGRTALCTGSNATLELWDVTNGRMLRTFSGHNRDVRVVAFSPDGRTALSGGYGGYQGYEHVLKLWDVATGRGLSTFRGHSDLVNAIAYAADGRSALSGSDDHTVRLWNLNLT